MQFRDMLPPLKVVRFLLNEGVELSQLPPIKIGGLQLNSNGFDAVFTVRCDGPVDSSPRRDVDRSDAVRRSSETAGGASKLIPPRPVRPGHSSARWTCAGRVPGIDVGYGDACKGGLVIHKLPELVESPGEVLALDLRFFLTTGSSAL